MIECKKLTTEQDFKDLSKGDIVAVEWHRDAYKGKKRTRFATYTVFDNHKDQQEIILQKKMNVYFSYLMFLTEGSNCKSIVKLSISAASGVE